MEGPCFSSGGCVMWRWMTNVVLGILTTLDYNLNIAWKEWGKYLVAWTFQSISVVTLTLCLIRRRSDEFLVSSIFPAVKYEVALCCGVFGPAPTFHPLPLDGTPSWTADVAHDAFFFGYLALQSCRKTSAHCSPRQGLDESIEVDPVYFWDGLATLEHRHLCPANSPEADDFHYT
jgi:hypothetical protein